MAEFCLGMFTDITFQLVPGTFVVTDFLAGGAYRQYSVQLLDCSEGRLEFNNKLLLFLFCLLLL